MEADKPSCVFGETCRSAQRDQWYPEPRGTATKGSVDGANDVREGVDVAVGHVEDGTGRGGMGGGKHRGVCQVTIVHDRPSIEAWTQRNKAAPRYRQGEAPIVALHA